MQGWRRQEEKARENCPAELAHRLAALVDWTGDGGVSRFRPGSGMQNCTQGQKNNADDNPEMLLVPGARLREMRMFECSAMKGGKQPGAVRTGWAARRTVSKSGWSTTNSGTSWHCVEASVAVHSGCFRAPVACLLCTAAAREGERRGIAVERCLTRTAHHPLGGAMSCSGLAVSLLGASHWQPGVISDTFGVNHSGAVETIGGEGMYHGRRQEHQQDSRRLHEPAQLPWPADHGSVICVREQTHVIPVASSGFKKHRGTGMALGVEVAGHTSANLPHSPV